MKRSNTGNTDLVTATGVFSGYAEAHRAIDALRAAGYQNDQIGVIGPGDREESRAQRSGLPGDPLDTQWEEGSGIGAAAGGLAGLGLGAAVAAGLMSPLGPVVAGGTIVALIASAGAGAAVGTVVGALVGAGIPEEDAQWQTSELEAGRVLVTVRAADSAHARRILDEHGATNRPSETAIPGHALPATPY